jgi:carbonic anhydrase
MDDLLSGIHQFHTHVFARERAFFEQLAEGQSPRALVVSCSDSRVDPNLILQADPGELFSLRNAGNMVPAYGAVRGGEAASVEYAIAALGVEHVIVCGHSQCGAVKAMLDPSSAAGLTAVEDWLDHAETTRRIMRENYSHLSGARKLEVAVQEHVLVQVENLQTHPAVAARLQRGALQLHAWIYELETGLVSAYSSETESFEPLGAGQPLPKAVAKRTAGRVRGSTKPRKA